MHQLPEPLVVIPTHVPKCKKSELPPGKRSTLKLNEAALSPSSVSSHTVNSVLVLLSIEDKVFDYNFSQ